MTANTKLRLFCDSKIAFDQMIDRGMVPRDALVLTRSFVLAGDNTVNSVYLDEKLSSTDRQKFKLGIKAAEKQLSGQLDKTEISSAQKLICLQLYNKFQNEVFDACLLGEDAEFEGKTIIVVPKLGTERD